MASLTSAQNMYWQWAKSATAFQCNGMCTDQDGNAYITGEIVNNGGVFGNISIPNYGSSNVFIAKYDTSGNVIWATNAGGRRDDWGQGICTDAAGNVYITGEYNSYYAYFGSNVLTYNTESGSSVFIAKYDNSGNCLWARSPEIVGGAFGDEGFSLCSDIYSDVYVTGTFSDSILIFGNDTLQSYGAINAFIAKYDSAGNVLWARQTGGFHGQVVPWSASTDPKGNVYIAGSCNGGTISFGTDTLASSVFLAKYDAGGNVLWARGPSGNPANNAYGVCTDLNCNVYLTGFFAGDSITFGSVILTNIDSNKCCYGQAAFIVKYDSLGNVVWARKSGTSFSGNPNSISSDKECNIYITGTYSLFYSNSTGGTNIGLTFVVKYDSAGSEQWVQVIRTNYFNNIPCIAESDKSGNVYLSTGYTGDVIINNDTLINGVFLGGDTLTGKGIFVARLATAIDKSPIDTMPENIIKLYPNPTIGNLYFGGLKAGYTFEIYTLLGQLIQSDDVTNSSGTIDINNAAAGVYFYKILSGNALIKAGKLVIQ